MASVLRNRSRRAQSKFSNRRPGIVQPVIEVDELTMPFGDREVLKNLHIALFGRIIGLSEPNGTGKSTLIHSLSGFCPARYASARILGHDTASAHVALSRLILFTLAAPAHSACRARKLEVNYSEVQW